MKTLVRIAGGLAVILVLALGSARVFGFNPGATAPGLWLKGEVVTTPVTDWSFGASVKGLTGVETRQWFAPFVVHSVTTTRFHLKDRLYLASGYPAGIKLPKGRHWNRNVLADPHIRVRMGNKIYPAKLTYLQDGPERQEVIRAWGPMMFAPGFYLHLWRVESTGTGDGK